MNRIVFLIALLLAAGTVQAAQLYRWVDDKGRVKMSRKIAMKEKDAAAKGEAPAEE